MMKIFTVILMTVVANNEICSAKFLHNMPGVESGDIWLPRELGRFHLKDAAFVEVYETTPSLKTNDDQNTTVYADQYNLYITTFNAGILLIFIFKIKFSHKQRTKCDCALFLIHVKFLLIINIYGHKDQIWAYFLAHKIRHCQMSD